MAKITYTLKLIVYNDSAFLFVLFHLFCVNLAFAQNLIPDSSFENNKWVPVFFSEIHASHTWNRPSLGTSDLFCKCSGRFKKQSQVNVPENPMGNQLAHSGTCYAGFFAHSHGNYREYIQTPLKTTLEKNKVYRLTFYFSLADYSRATVDQLGFSFLDKAIKYHSTGQITQQHPHYLTIQSTIRSDTSKWHRLSYRYKADGDEQYLIIGSFAVNTLQKTKIKAPLNRRSRINQSTERDAYYFIDDVSLMETSDTLFDNTDEPPMVTASAPNPIKESDSLPPLPHLLFESNASALSELSMASLNKVAAFLIKHPLCSVELAGYTDNTGSEKQNILLSEKRVEAVARYLILNQVDEKQIIARFFGDANPLEANTTETGKQRNRRVECRLLSVNVN